MSIKLVAFDMDGTALTSKKELPPHINEQIIRLHKKGIICAPATGRFYETVKDKFRDASNLMSCVACNGHEIYCEGKLISLSKFKPETVKMLTDFADQYEDLFSTAFSLDEGFARSSVETWPRRAALEYGPMTLCSDYDLKHTTLIKCSFYSTKNINVYCNLFNQVMRDAPQSVHGVVTSDITFDVSLNGMNKGKGVQYLAQYLGIDMSEVMAIGDHMNDAEMLTLAGEGVAVANAIPELKAIASRVTVSNDDYAVLHELRKL